MTYITNLTNGRRYLRPDVVAAEAIAMLSGADDVRAIRVELGDGIAFEVGGFSFKHR